MNHPSEHDSNANSLPEAVEVKRETLQKIQVQILELPVAHFEESEASDAPIAEGGESEGDDDDELSGEGAEFAAPEKSLAEQQKLVNRRALDATNRGKDPDSRSFIRGILHTSPGKVVSAAFFALLFRISLPVFIVLTALIVLHQVEVKYAWFILILPLAGLLHLLTMNQARCRVCGMKEFAPSRAFKHKHSHRFLFFGPVISTALHVLIFKWFRCLFCGTPIRIKK